jgi:NTE family protein
MAIYKNLVFKGGGVLGIAYAGAMKVLQEHNLLSSIEKVAGTSAGSIMATLVALKYNAQEVQQIVDGTNFKTFEDDWNPLRVATKYGIYEGDAFLEWIKKYISQKGMDENATFTDFHNNGMLDLHVFASDLNTRRVKEFSYATTPTTIVAEAVRASMSIPVFFKAWRFSNGVPDSHLYVDGGVVLNYPINAFDSGASNPETLGFYLTNLNDTPYDDQLHYDEMITYVKNLFTTLLDAQDIDFKTDPDELDRTVLIDNLGISATDFGLTEDQKTALYNSGVEGTTNFFKAKGLIA